MSTLPGLRPSQPSAFPSQDKPRVLIVIDHGGPGGAQVVVSDILCGLRDQFAFSVAILGEPGMHAARYQTFGVPVFQLAGPLGKWDASPLGSLARLIQAGQIDLVHTLLFKSHILGTMAAAWRQRRSICHDEIGIYPSSLEHFLPNGFVRSAYLQLYRNLLPHCSRVLVLTPQDLRGYQRYRLAPSERITVLPNALDLASFVSAASDSQSPLRRVLGLPAETRLVTMVGRLAPEKDFETFLGVAQVVQCQGRVPCAFLVVGSGSEEARLRALVERHSIPGVFFLGYRADVPALLRQSDVFLLTSRREPFGIVVLEAMAAGVPVVATRSGGPEAILAHGVDGLLARPADVASLAGHVMRLLEDPALARRLAAAAFQKLVQGYSLRTFTARLAEIYQDVLREPV